MNYYIKVKFKQAIVVRQLAIVENWNPGAIARIFGYDEQGNEYLLYQNTGAKPKVRNRFWRVQIEEPIPQKLNAVKLLINHRMSRGIKQYDAIAISNSEELIQFEINLAENIPEDNNCFDTVVITYALCTIPDMNKAFEEIRRVLRPSGKLIFCEHGKAPDKAVQKWQNLVNPIWKQLGGGCNLNRDIPLIITDNGFNVVEMETMYIPGWKPASFNYWGTAKQK